MTGLLPTPATKPTNAISTARKNHFWVVKDEEEKNTKEINRKKK